VRRAVYVALLLTIAVVVGCGRNKNGGGRTLAAQTRPIVVVLHQKNAECQATFGKRPQHAFKGDEISWEFINTCNADQSVTLAIKSNFQNPFTDTSPPWTITAKADNASNPDEKNLKVAQTASGSYRFDIVVGGKTYDPKLEIDP
jgi:hypothetical protein